MWGCEIISDKETISGAPGFTGFDNTQIRGHQLKLSEGRFLLNDFSHLSIHKVSLNPQAVLCMFAALLRIFLYYPWLDIAGDILEG